MSIFARISERAPSDSIMSAAAVGVFVGIFKWLPVFLLFAVFTGVLRSGFMR